jgi:DnaJ-class molecular chaperone
MAVGYKDYYKILGVERTASEDEIRKAFRKLARQHHPDVAKTNKAQAEEKFKEINEAYDVLSDPEKRKRYDALGANWKQGGEFHPPPGWEAFGGGRPGGGRRSGRAGGVEFEFGGTGFSDFFEQLFGARGRNGGFGVPAEETAERGRDLETDILITLPEAVRGSLRSIALRRIVPCRDCDGTGQKGRQTCPTCGGSGQTAQTETHQVKIPAGVRDGQKLRVSGKGETGASGGGHGDLFLNIRLAAHPDFRVEQANLFHDLDLAPWEAALGAQVAVPTLEGNVSIKIPPGTPSGRRLRVRGRGLGKEGARGDLVVITRIQVPETLSDTERQLWEKLARESQFNPRD